MVNIQAFQQIVWEYYRKHGRHDLPWRQIEPDGSIDPYKVVVSEMMLQQTQVPRVIPKFNSFICQFSDFKPLATAPLSEVLTAWNGLGYNRRAKFLWQTAGVVVGEYGATLPSTSIELVRLPGIGPNTAGAILAYVYNRPVIFIETNIRTVFIHHFFADVAQVSDKDIADKVAETLPENTREWYWALMDYGTYLKQTVGSLNDRSKHYSRQSVFAGSRRQIRGQVLRLLAGRSYGATELFQSIGDDRLQAVLDDLISEGLIVFSGSYYKLPSA